MPPGDITSHKNDRAEMYQAALDVQASTLKVAHVFSNRGRQIGFGPGGEVAGPYTIHSVLVDHAGNGEGIAIKFEIQ